MNSFKIKPTCLRNIWDLRITKRNLYTFFANNSSHTIRQTHATVNLISKRENIDKVKTEKEDTFRTLKYFTLWPVPTCVNERYRDNYNPSCDKPLELLVFALSTVCFHPLY